MRMIFHIAFVEIFFLLFVFFISPVIFLLTNTLIFHFLFFTDLFSSGPIFNCTKQALNLNNNL